MTDADFTFDLERAFREHAPGLDAAALERAILGRVEETDRQRRLVLLGATSLGLAIALVAVFATGFGSALRHAWLVLQQLDLTASGASPSEWLLALVGLVVLASSIVHAARDS